ncbi:hypothetical protein EAH77_09370 [Ewingella americana]|uniref:Uncharacterized protein n=1 Tax=Ewingella americana TaxID=41202 RepID=A0A502GKM2_9GAMM|nr:hypothetical protein EAH77_09370 [Ewingella americana]
MPKTFSTEETESGCLSRSAIAIVSLTCSLKFCFKKNRTRFSLYWQAIRIRNHQPELLRCATGIHNFSYNIKIILNNHGCHLLITHVIISPLLIILMPTLIHDSHAQ